MQSIMLNPIPHTPGPSGLFKIFYGVTGVGMVALLTGFGPCLFDLEQIDQCADYAVYATDTLQEFGEHVLQWAFAMFDAIMRRV